MSNQTSQLLKLLTIVCMLFSMLALAYVGWQERQPIIEKFTGPKVRASAARVPNPSEETIVELKNFVNAQSWIEGINIVKVDFIQNQRSTTFRYFKTQDVTDAWNALKPYYAPVFGTNEANNQRIVNLINGNSYCTDIHNSTTVTVLPMIVKYAATICPIPIPPGYGDFIGFVTIFLKKAPNSTETAYIIKHGEELALRMYERDVVKSHRKFDELGNSNVIR